MKIEKQTYKILYRGKRFSFTLYTSEAVATREKVLVHKKQKCSDFPIRSY